MFVFLFRMFLSLFLFFLVAIITNSYGLFIGVETPSPCDIKQLVIGKHFFRPLFVVASDSCVVISSKETFFLLVVVVDHSKKKRYKGKNAIIL